MDSSKREEVKRFCFHHGIKNIHIAKRAGVMPPNVTLWFQMATNSPSVSIAVKALISERKEKGDLLFDIEV